MIFTIHGKNFELNDLEKEAIINSLNRLKKFEKFIKPDTKVKVEVRRYNHEKTYKITVNINLPYDKHLKCEIKNHSLAIVIDQMINPLTQQLNHLKTQVENKNFRSAGQAILTHDQEISAEYAIEELDDEILVNQDDYGDES